MSQQSTSSCDVRGQVELDDLRASLTRPEAYDPDLRVDEVDVVETHISLLFFAGDRVYKLKKGVELDFLDYSTPERRRKFCDEELRLNRRISPGMYLGVRPVTAEGDAHSVDGDGPIVDWVVEMLRLPEAGMLPNRLEQESIADEDLERLVATLASFHSRAQTGPEVNRHGLPRTVVETVRENLDQLASIDAGDWIPDGARAFLERRFEHELEEQRERFERRIADGHIREGHGDLHAGNICLVDDEIHVYDCVEFDFTLRCADYASDLAFLVMDLEQRGHPRFARDLVGAYAAVASDDDLEAMVDFYFPHRALIRAKVEATRAQQLEERADAAAALRTARTYLQLALAHAAPSLVVALAGGEARSRERTATHLLGRFGSRTLADGVEPSTDADHERAAKLLSAGGVAICNVGRDPDALDRLADVAARLGRPRLLLTTESDAAGSADGSWTTVTVDPDASELDHAQALFEALIDTSEHGREAR